MHLNRRLWFVWMRVQLLCQVACFDSFKLVDIVLSAMCLNTPPSPKIK